MMMKNKKTVFSKLRIFPKTFLSMSLVFLILILIVHGLIYVLMNQTYAAEKQLLAEKNLEELRVRISEKPADQIREICEKFAIQKNVNLNLKIDGKVQHLQGFSEADIVTEDLLGSDTVPLVNNEQLGSILVSKLEVKDAKGGKVLVQMLSNVESLNEARNATLKILPLSFSVSMLMALVFSYFYTRLFVKPIERIAKVTRRMQKMEEVYCEERRNDEIGELAEDINKLYLNLRQMIGRLEEEKGLISKLEKEKVDLIRGASHELKTPLSSLHIMLENMLIGTVRTEDYPEKLEAAILVVEKMSKMIEQILYTSRAGEGNKARVDVGNLVQEVILEYELLAKTRGIAFESRISRMEIQTSQSAMREVFSNLISNAVKYAEAGSVIKIICEKGKFSIWNPGEEISAQEVPVLFDPFYRRDNEVGGNGMGLYFVKNILTRLGLQYRFSAYKGGMKFEIWFK